jgi:hypothetical protein
MQELVRNCIVVGGLVLPVFIAASFRRRGGFLAIFFLGLAFVEAWRLQVAPPETWRLWPAAFPLHSSLRMLAWFLLFWLVRWAGGCAAPRSGSLGALLGGLGFGPAAGVGLSASRSPRESSRLVLVALAASLVSPVGNPVAWVLGEPRVALELLPLSVLLLVLAWSRHVEVGGSRLLGLLALPLWLFGCFQPEVAMAAALVVAGVAAARRGLGFRPKISLSTVLWAATVPVGFTLLLLSGVLDVLGQGLYSADLVLADALPLSFSGAAMLLSASATALPAALCAFEIRSLDSVRFTLELRAALAAGASVGAGMLLLRSAGRGVLRAGMLRWLLGALVTLLFSYFYL